MYSNVSVPTRLPSCPFVSERKIIWEMEHDSSEVQGPRDFIWDLTQVISTAWDEDPPCVKWEARQVRKGKARCASLYCPLPFAQMGCSSLCEWVWAIDPRVPCQCMPVRVTSALYLSCHFWGLVHHSVPRDILAASQPNSLSVRRFPCIQMSYPSQIHLTNGADFLNKSKNVYL